MSVIRIFALTEPGRCLAENLAKQLEGAQVSYKPKPFDEEVHRAFRAGEKLIFICATGIVIRTLAPVLVNKHEDPPVLVMDEQGEFVIPLLSGHEGGANEWGRIVAETVGATLVLTTANAYLKPVYTVGMGCERNCPASELRKLLDHCLTQTQLDISEIKALTSIDIKADEKGLIELAQSLDKPFLTWSKEELSEVDSQLSERSDYVYQTVGVYGVAESAALYAAQRATSSVAELVLTKHKTKKATCAIARSYLNEA